MGKPSAPQAPNPVATANAQTASNKDTAISQTWLNAMDQRGPQGAISYTQTGTAPDGTPRFTQTTSLSPSEQAIYDANVRTRSNLASVSERQSNTIGNVLSSQFNTDGAPALRTSLGGSNDYSADRQKVEDALMGRLNTQIDRDRAAMESSLANRGIRLGSQAYSDAMQDFSRGVAENRTSAILNAGQEQNRMQGLDLNAANFTNNARSQFLNERLTARNQALNENIGLATGTQVGTPSFAPTPTTGVAGTDIAGITANSNAAAQSAYGQQMGQWNNTMGGLFSLGAAALPFMFSDKRLKTDIEATGEKVAGVPVKTFRWKETGKPDVGVIAQDVEKRHPSLVKKTADGTRMVNYGGLMRLGRDLGKAA